MFKILKCIQTVCVSLFYVIDTASTGPGGEPGDCLSTLHTYSYAGCADLPLALLGSSRDSRFESAGVQRATRQSCFHFYTWVPDLQIVLQARGLLFITFLLPRQDLVQSCAAGGVESRSAERIALVKNLITIDSRSGTRRYTDTE